MNTYSARNIADYIISLSLSNENEVEEGLSEGITNLRLQKILYFAQAASLAIHDKELFSEEVEAWKYGPVVSEIYHSFKEYNNQAIPKPESTPELDAEAVEIIRGIWEVFSKYSTSELVSITHNHAPWKNFYQESKNVVIPKETLREYYKGIFQLQDNE